MMRLNLRSLAWLLYLVGATSPASAQAPRPDRAALAACQSEFRQCSTGCRSGALGALRACATQCQVQLRACTAGGGSPAAATAATVAAPEDAREPAAAGRPSAPLDIENPANWPPLSAPLSKTQVQEVFLGFDPADNAAHARKNQQPLDQLNAMQALPECKPGLPPFPCLQAREAYRKQQRDRKGEDNVARWLVLLPSMELDLAALPTEPLARLRAVQPLLQKYPGTRESAKGGDAGQTVLLALNKRMTREMDTLKKAPAVKEAYSRNELIGVSMWFSDVEEREWTIDQKTWFVTQRARRAVGDKLLFMERKGELEKSDRERDQAERWRQWGEPTATEIGLALLRVFANTGGRMLSPYESERDTFGMLKFVRGGMRLVHVEKDGCQNTAGGSWCLVRLWHVPVFRGPGTHIMTQGAQGMIQRRLAEEERGMGQGVVQLFRAGPQGWTAPQLVDRIFDRDSQMLDSASRSIEAVNHDICVQRKMKNDSYWAADAACQREKPR